MAQLTTKKAARILGVSEASIKRWVDRGQIGASKTPGGHRRLSEEALIEFARSNQYTMARPELLSTGFADPVVSLPLEQAHDAILEALHGQDKSSLLEMLAGWMREGRPLYQIFDTLAAPVFEQIGCQWEQNEIDISQERSACTLFLQVILELAAQFKPTIKKDLLAIGGALSGDWYSLPVAMVDLTLKEQGWKSLCLGSHLPAESMVKAIERRKPQLFWISVSHIANVETFLKDHRLLADACARNHTFMVLGGQALTPQLRKKLPETVFCDTLGHMVTLLKRIFEGPRP